MNDQLRILTTILQISVNKHGPDVPVTLGHLLNICRLAQKYETKVSAHEEAEYVRLRNEIDPLGQG